jgi:hypothetical protein
LDTLKKNPGKASVSGLAHPDKLFSDVDDDDALSADDVSEISFFIYFFILFRFSFLFAVLAAVTHTVSQSLTGFAHLSSQTSSLSLFLSK